MRRRAVDWLPLGELLMTRRPDPRSELFLSAAQVRATVACPKCYSPRGAHCKSTGGHPHANHAARVSAARAQARDARLTPP